MSNKDEIKALKKRIGMKAIEMLPKSGVVNIGYGIPSSYLIPELESNQDVMIQVESCVLGMKDSYGNIPHRVDPAGVMVNVHENGSRSATLTDAFSLMNRGKIDQTYLGALQVAANGDLANWASSESEKYGIGGAAELCAGAKEVIILMLENDRNGNSKLVKECTMPLTYPGCVSKVITEKGVYEPIATLAPNYGFHDETFDGAFLRLEVWSDELGAYEIDENRTLFEGFSGKPD